MRENDLSRNQEKIGQIDTCRGMSRRLSNHHRHSLASSIRLLSPLAGRHPGDIVYYLCVCPQHRNRNSQGGGCHTTPPSPTVTLTSRRPRMIGMWGYAPVGTTGALVCLFVCPRSKRKMVGAIDTTLGKPTVHGRTSACTDLEVKRSKVKVKFKLFFTVCRRGSCTSIRLPIIPLFFLTCAVTFGQPA